MTKIKLSIIAGVLALGTLWGVTSLMPDSCERAQARYDERVTGKAVPLPVALGETNKVLRACQP